jgi:hypothetical protein
VNSLSSIFRYFGRVLLILALLSTLAGSGLRLVGRRSEVRRYTRPLEFDFVNWTANALAAKFGQASLQTTAYLKPSHQSRAVLDLMSLMAEEARLDAELRDLFGEPVLEGRQLLIAAKWQELAQVEAELHRTQPLAEKALEEQVMVVLDAAGLDVAGVSFPPVAFRFSDVPFALIVSPRHVIRQDASIQLETTIDLERRIELERQVEAGLDVSALVVPVGGYGTYPTMIQDSSALSWVTEVVVHEWIHNYLGLRPLGLRYDISSDVRTMNETTATLLGQALGRRVLEAYYPELVSPQPPSGPIVAEAAPDSAQTDPEPAPPAFDFRAEMRATRLRVDELLDAGEIEAAETYMEQRRLVFWEQGYRIRRLNQAYFAFHGSYAAEPGGAAGDDPVGAAIRELWDRMDDPVQFLRTMAWMTGPQDLEQALGRPIPDR